MLTIFPTLLSWNQAAPLVIRLALGAILIHWSWKRFRKNEDSASSKAVAILDGVLGILFILGLWTQAAAAVFAIDLIVRIVKKIREKSFLTDGVNYYLILLILAFSLLVTGAGWVAFDLAV